QAALQEVVVAGFFRFVEADGGEGSVPPLGRIFPAAGPLSELPAKLLGSLRPHHHQHRRAFVGTEAEERRQREKQGGHEENPLGEKGLRAISTLFASSQTSSVLR